MALLDQTTGHSNSDGEEAEESYFVSMTDIMVGLLFIFIIMLMAFVLMLKEQERKLETERQQTAETREDILTTIKTVRNEVENVRDLEQERTQMLRDIQTRLKRHGVEVIVREGSGVLQLPEELLFDSDERSLDDSGHQAIGHVASALDVILPCYSQVPKHLRSRAQCDRDNQGQLRLQAVFVEGHTDREGPQAYNWELSADRAISTFQSLAEQAAVATDLRNDDDKYLFSIAGYGENRPAIEATTRAEMRQNRRIDLRFIMNRSYEDVLRRVESRLNSVLEGR
jgi:flagellar motor protein MotB